MGFSSKRQVEALKGAKEPSAHFLQQTGLTKSSTPIINQLLAGAEKAAQTGKTQDAAILKDALKGADDKAAEKIGKYSPQNENRRYSDGGRYFIFLVARQPTSIDKSNTRSLAGHAFIGGINNKGTKEAYGFYPSDNDTISQIILRTYDPEKQTGLVKNDISALESALAGDALFAFIPFEVTHDQYYATIRHIKGYASSNDYGLLRNNCVHAALSAIRVSGINTSFTDGVSNSPTELYAQISIAQKVKTLADLLIRSKHTYEKY